MANGTSLELMDMEFTLGQMVIDMKESGTFVLNMVLELTLLALVMFILVNTKMGRLMVKDSILGKMARYIQVNLKMD